MQTANLQTMLRPLIPGYTVPPVTRTITLIVIHCTASRCTSNLTPETLELLHRQRGFNGCGYHYYIQKNGTIHPMRPLNLAGAHAYGHNAHSIGIAYEGGLLSDGTAADTRTIRPNPRTPRPLTRPQPQRHNRTGRVHQAMPLFRCHPRIFRSLIPDRNTDETFPHEINFVSTPGCTHPVIRSAIILLTSSIR